MWNTQPAVVGCKPLTRRTALSPSQHCDCSLLPSGFHFCRPKSPATQVCGCPCPLSPTDTGDGLGAPPPLPEALQTQGPNRPPWPCSSRCLAREPHRPCPPAAPPAPALHSGLLPSSLWVLGFSSISALVQDSPDTACRPVSYLLAQNTECISPVRLTTPFSTLRPSPFLSLPVSLSCAPFPLSTHRFLPL